MSTGENLSNCKIQFDSVAKPAAFIDGKEHRSNFGIVPCGSRIKKKSIPPSSKLSIGENPSNCKIQFDSVAKQMLKQKSMKPA